MLSKRYESTEVDRRTLLHVPSGTHLSTSSDTRQVVEIQIETSSQMYTPFLIGLILRFGPYAHFGYWSSPSAVMKAWLSLLRHYAPHGVNFDTRLDIPGRLYFPGVCLKIIDM